MKKYIIYIVLLFGGIFLGYLFFNSSDKENKSISKESAHGHNEEIWTCSMHPQIRQNEPGDCPICGMELIPLESEQAGNSPDEIKMTKNAMALANIETSIIGEANADSGDIGLTGKIEINEEATAVQAAYVKGRLENFKIEFVGQEIKRGQLIAEIYSPQLVAAQQELLSAAKNKKNQARLYQAVKNKLKAWKLTDKQIDAIESSKNIRRNFPVYAQTSGTVSEKLVVTGDYIEEGQALFKVTPLHKVWAVFEAYENQIQQLKEKQKVKIMLNAYPDKTFTGEINFISPVLDKTSRTVEIRVVLNNKKNLLKPGMFVKAAVNSSENKEGKPSLLVPKSAVLWTGERSVVYVQPKEDVPVFEMRQVQLGNATKNSYQIIKGLKAGDEVVTNGTFTVDAAAQLQGKKSMLNQASKKIALSGKNQELITTYFKRYFSLKKALVKSDSLESNNSIADLKKTLKKVEKEDKNPKFNETLKNIKKSVSYLGTVNTLKKQRDYFIGLSIASIALAENTSVTQNMYVQECPMANSNKGAKWLSLEKEIKNPYYGDAMLNCGSVIDVLK